MTTFPKNLRRLLNNQIFFFAILFLTIFLARLGTWFFPLDSDHWIFFVVGKEFIQGKILYAEIWDHKPPLIFLINGLMSLTLGNSLLFHRVFFTLWLLAETALFYNLTKQILQFIQIKQLALSTKLTVLFYAYWRNLSQFTSSGNNTENFGLIFLIGLYSSYFYYKTNARIRWLLISGICLSTIIFLKPNFILLSLPIWFDLSLELLAKIWQKQWMVVWHLLHRTFVKFVIFLLPLLTQTALWLWYFIANNALSDFWFGFYEFSAKYLQSSWQGVVSDQTLFLLISTPFYLLFGLFLSLFIWQNRQFLFSNQVFLSKSVAESKPQEARIFVLVSGISGIIFISILGGFYPYYYLILMPILSLLVFSLDWGKLPAIFVMALIAVMITTASISYLISSKQLYNGLSGSVREEEQEIHEISKYINENTTLDDTIYGYVYGATFYQLSGRQPASEYVSGSVLILDFREHYGFNLNQKVIEDLKVKQPKFIILYKNNQIYEANTELMNFLYQSSCYQPDREWLHYKTLKNTQC